MANSKKLLISIIFQFATLAISNVTFSQHFFKKGEEKAKLQEKRRQYAYCDSVAKGYFNEWDAPKIDCKSCEKKWRLYYVRLINNNAGKLYLSKVFPFFYWIKRPPRNHGCR